MIIFPASSQRPQDYPERLPFIANALVEITEFPDAVVMKWFGVERPFDVVQQLTGASAKEGWTRDRQQETAAATWPPEKLRFTLGSLQREIEVLQAGPFTSVIMRERQRDG